MNDRKLTELAAKAMGYFDLGGWDERRQCFWNGEGWSFEPLSNNGDAFSLAVARNIKVEQDEKEGRAIATYHNDGWAAIEPHGDDPEKATRRAIVIAVAYQYLSETQSPKGGA